MFIRQQIPYVGVRTYSSIASQSNFLAFLGLFCKTSCVNQELEALIMETTNENRRINYICNHSVDIQDIKILKQEMIARGSYLFEGEPLRENINSIILKRIKKGFVVNFLRTIMYSDSFDFNTVQLLKELPPSEYINYIGIDHYPIENKKVIGLLGYSRLYNLLTREEKIELLEPLKEFIKERIDNGFISTRSLNDYYEFETYILGEEIFTFTP